MTTGSTDQFDSNAEPDTAMDPSAGAARSIGRAATALVRRHSRVAGALGLIAATAIIAGAYVIGGPPATGADATVKPAASAAPADLLARAPLTDNSLSDKNLQEFSAATQGAAPDGSVSGGSTGASTGASGGGTVTPQDALASSIDSTQIVKTGQMSLEVSGLDTALSQAQTTVAGLGGSVDSSNRSGTDDYAMATVTFRVPVAKWDEALSDLRKIGSKVLSEQTNSSDVTGQAIDLDARITNLKTTETALQGIMARASAIPDVIAVENQLSQTQGSIEELTAQLGHLKDQAAMSTLTVTFQLPGKTVITQATQDWTLSGQIDQAGAALVRIGQGLATAGVWIVVVVVPLGLALLVLLGIVVIFRRVAGRESRKDAVAGA